MAGMDGSYPSKLRVWEAEGDGWTKTMVQEVSASANGRTVLGAHSSAELADQLYAFETLDRAGGRRPEEGAEPYTLQWFLNIENRRHGRQGRRIPRLLGFAKPTRRTFLGL